MSKQRSINFLRRSQKKKKSILKLSGILQPIIRDSTSYANSTFTIMCDPL